VIYHKNLRHKHTLHSELDDIPGIGAQRKIQLLRYFGSLKQMREASCAELAAVPGISTRVAQAVYDHFHTTPVA
jgi:excinuclease ABC subunit C